MDKRGWPDISFGDMKHYKDWPAYNSEPIDKIIKILILINDKRLKRRLIVRRNK